MTTSAPRPVGGRSAPAARAAIVEEPGLGPAERLGAALDRVGFWTDLSHVVERTDATAGSLPIVILPETGAFARGSPAAADPALVEVLIDLLHDRGYESVIIAAGADDSARWAANRGAYALTDLLGYRFVTPKGRDYDIVDLGDDLEAAPFQRGDVLHGTALSRVWTGAGVRIVFATNATHADHGFALGLHTVLRALPLVHEHGFHPDGTHPGDLVSELLRVAPVHLTLVDGIVSCHGSGGMRAPRAIETGCIIASTDLWLADTVGAIKMGLDPGASPMAARSPWLGRDIAATQIDGGLSVYEGWIPPSSLLLDAARRRGEASWWSRLVRPWLQILDPALFALESPLDARMNSRLAERFALVDDDDTALAALVMANLLAAGIQEAVDAYRVLYHKDAVRRIAAPLGFDPGSHSPAAYRRIVPELAALRRLLDGAPERRPGLRWRHLDGAVLFEYRREIPLDFDEFVAHVDVSRAISYMNDYIGGVVVPLEWDETGRPVRQAERNLYLPQPNYLVLSAGGPIDVSKLEVVEYGDDRHTLFWKTIDSENESATYDDGTITFARSERGTDVTIFGRQLFVLPPVWQLLDEVLGSPPREHLITDAYSTFFDRTLANLEALAEGRDIRIGRPPAGSGALSPLPVAVIERWIEEFLDWLGTLRSAGPPSRGDDRAVSSSASHVDSDGFTHFAAPPRSDPTSDATRTLTAQATTLWVGLAEAGLRDLEALVRSSRP